MAHELIFMTGATGVLGQDLVKELLETTKADIAILARAKGRKSHSDRVAKILKEMELDRHLGARIRVIEGDVTHRKFGIKKEDLEFLERECEVFYHIAALTALNGTEKECQSINVGGTEHALELAWDLRKKGKLKQFVYFSTAFVAGSIWNHCSKEDTLPKNPGFANYYESSKYKAETKVRESMAKGMPTTIIRPSIVVGHSVTGVVSDFNVIYPFFKLFAHGAISKLPTHLENTFNIVPIDFVIKAICEIVKNPKSLNKAFHLVAPHPPTIGALLKMAKDEYPNVPPIEIIDPKDFQKSKMSAQEQMVFGIMEPYLGYLNGHLTFDMTNTREILRGTGCTLPKTDSAFLKTMIRYAVEAGYLVL